MLASQESIVRAAVVLAGARITVLGCADDNARPTLAAGFGKVFSEVPGGVPAGTGHEVRALSDLRSMLASAVPADGPIVLFDAGALLKADRAGPDVELLRQVRQRGIAVLSLEPLPAVAADLASAASVIAPAAASMPLVLGPLEVPVTPERDAAMRLVAELTWWAGLSRHSAGFVEIGDLLTNFGPVQAMAVTATASRAEGSLRARLADGLDQLAVVMGQAESVFGVVSKAHEANQQASVLLRYGNGRSGVVFAALAGGPIQRSAVMTGPGGRLEITSGPAGTGVLWTDNAGKVIDQSRKRPRRRAGDSGAQVAAEGQEKPAHSTIADLIAKQLRRVLETGTTDVLAASGRPDLAGLVATIGAAELSSDTGVAERPAMLLSAAG